ncbi:hypothetical protein [Planctomycetes bacterium TBK1r]|uniref:Uncharacterized protein n=1 Tax=Stieleria magnilauensis TaxID=2527963 RepID=A0ABX5XWS5_9BACT|nr:hypothetical protein TBK1r_54920 [Planctomycetes bacterium TBK1r]
MTNNPYSSPTTDATTDHAASTVESGASVVELAKPVFLAWERLRIAYILLLGAFTAMLAMPGVISNGPQLLTFRGLIMIAEGAIVANVLYFAGPIVETYVRWLGYDRTWVRWFLFAGGTLLTALFALVSLASGLIPNQN